MSLIDKSISSRYLNQDDRIEIADGLKAGEPVRSQTRRLLVHLALRHAHAIDHVWHWSHWRRRRQHQA